MDPLQRRPQTKDRHSTSTDICHELRATTDRSDNRDASSQLQWGALNIGPLLRKQLFPDTLRTDTLARFVVRLAEVYLSASLCPLPEN